MADRQSLMEEGIKADTPTVRQKHRLKIQSRFNILVDTHPH